MLRPWVVGTLLGNGRAMRVVPAASLVAILTLLFASPSIADTSEADELSDPAVRAETLIGRLTGDSPPAVAEKRNPRPGLAVAADLGPGEATAVNDMGTVVGHTDGDPWMWRGGKRTPLPTFGGHAWPESINARGDAVGSAMIDGRRKGVRWRRGDIELLEGFVRATDVNDRGEVVGVGPEGAVHWRRGILRRLPDLGEGGAAYGISQAGHVVGHVNVEGEWWLHQRLALWRNGSLLDLGDLLGHADVQVGYDINDSNQIVGISQSLGCCYDAFRLDGPSNSPAWLGGRGYYRVASAVDQWGRTVGWSLAEYDGPSAMVWNPDGSVLFLEGYDNTVLFAEPGWWNIAKDINGTGMVVGYAYDGVDTPDREQRAVVWQLPRTP